MLAAALVALAVLSSWVGVRNGFTYDDVFIVETNKVLRNLSGWWRLFGQPYWPMAWGADGYRPLTMLAFMLEWAADGGKPWVFHATNIALYAAVSVSLFYLARTCLPLAGAWLAAALFAVHPLHVEAVGNIVGQSELWTALFVIPAVTIYINARNANELTISRMLAIGLLYVLACLSKEHGIVLPAILVAAELTVVVDRTPLVQRFVKLRPFVLALGAVGLAYLLAHTRVSSEELTGFKEYVPFSSMHLNTAGRLWTMFGLVPDWIRLFLWPAHLSVEYGPPEYPVVMGFAAYQIPGLIIFAAVAALAIAGRKRSPVAAFGIAFAFITLLPTSNLLVPSGILLAERTLFLPSAGVMIAVGAVVPWLYKRMRRPVQLAAAGAFAVIIALGVWRTSERTKIWKSNDTLFAQAVIDAPFVYRTHFMLGAWEFHLKHKVVGERNFQRSMLLYDRDPYVFFSLGQEYLAVGMYRSAATLFRRTLEIDPSVTEARARLALALAEMKEWDAARKEALQTLSEDTRSVAAMRRVLALAARNRLGEPEPQPGSILGDTLNLKADSGKVLDPMQKARKTPGSS